MNRAAPAIIFIATVKLRVIQLTHQNLQLHHPALLVRIQILGQTLRADEEVARRAAQQALLARRFFNFPGACSKSGISRDVVATAILESESSSSGEKPCARKKFEGGYWSRVCS